MIIPVGHESDHLKSAPVVTFTIMILCVLVLAYQGRRFNREAVMEENAVLQELTYLVKDRDYLDVPPDVQLMVDRTNNLLDRYRQLMDQMGMSEEERERFFGRDGDEDDGTYEADTRDYDDPSNYYETEPTRKRTVAVPEAPSAVSQAVEQAHLDDLVARLRASSESLWFTNWGYVPAARTLRGLIAYNFIHADIWHLLGNMLFFYLFAPLIEDRYGRAFFAGFFLLGGMFSGFMYGLHFSESALPLVGASGAVFVVLGGYLVKHWRDKIRFAFIFGFRGRMFSVPAWVAVPFWFAKELMMGLIKSGIDPTGATGGVAHLVHVWGFVFGAGVVFAMSRTGLEDRFWPPPVDLDAPEESGAVRAALKAERLGRFGEALNLLRAGCRDAPDDVDLLQNYWRLARDKGRIQDMVNAGQRLMERDVDQGQAQMAHVRFREIIEVQGNVHFAPGLITRLCKGLVADRYYVEAEEILRHTYEHLPSANARVLFPLLEVAASMQSPLGLTIAERLRSAEGFNQESETDRLVAEIEAGMRAGRPAQDDSVSISGGGISLELADAHEFMDMGPPPKNVHALKVFDALPQKLERDGLTLDIDGAVRKVPFDGIKLVAVGVVRAQGQKPLLVIDLVFDRPRDVLPLHRVLRITSARFNPLTLMPKMEKPGPAYRRFVEIVLKMSGGEVAPSRTEALGPYKNYPDLRAFERDIYYGT